jgi:uncharacterized protein YndB with AHSA1/START domain
VTVDTGSPLETALRSRWVSMTRLLDAPPARVYRAWSDPEEFASWFPITVEGSLSVSARTILTWHDRRIPIEVVDAEPAQLFRFRWAWLPDQTYITNVTVKLRPHGYGTLLTLSDGVFDLLRPGVLEAYAEALEGWGEALAGLRAQVDFSVDIRTQAPWAANR